jgi:hypothetical protein
LTDVRSEEIDTDLANKIAEHCVALAPELTGGNGTIESLDVIRHCVGLRPARRGGARLEVENIPEIGMVVHNYGFSFAISSNCRRGRRGVSGQLGNGNQRRGASRTNSW